MKRKKLKLAIELVPSSAWHKSLHREMPRRRWDRFRKEVIAKSGGKCEICGSTERLHCHEVWSYDEKLRVQKLLGFQTICSMCNFVKHIGMAENLAQEGRVNLEAVINHFLRVNRVKRGEFDIHKRYSFELWRKRSTIKWRVDLGKFGQLIKGNGR